MYIKVITPNNGWYLYSHVTKNSNIDGTLRLEGKDEDGDWTMTFAPGEWTEIEIVEKRY